MTARFNIDHAKFDLEITNYGQIKYRRNQYTIVVFPTTRWDGCPILGIYVIMDTASGEEVRLNKEFDGLDYAMAWVDNQLNEETV